MIAKQGDTPLSASADFIVLNASAGSGKTYSLVQHILMNALRKKDMDHAYQKVLAITFTNNAAAEMKARLVRRATVRSYRRHIWFSAFILGAFLSPPDPLSLFLVAMPVVILFEIAIVIDAITRKEVLPSD